jgi:hypothetical protein
MSAISTSSVLFAGPASPASVLPGEVFRGRDQQSLFVILEVGKMKSQPPAQIDFFRPGWT